MKQNEFEIKDDGYNENLNYGNPLGVHNKWRRESETTYGIITTSVRKC